MEDTTLELLAELVAECGRGAAYELRERLGFDTHVDAHERTQLVARLSTQLRADFGIVEREA